MARVQAYRGDNGVPARPGVRQLVIEDRTERSGDGVVNASVVIESLAPDALEQQPCRSLSEQWTRTGGMLHLGRVLGPGDPGPS